MAAAQQVKAVQEGSRWLHAPPAGTDLGKWFKENVKLHDDLEHADYLAGITLIPNKERVRQTRLDSDGAPQIVDVERLVFTPYPKVETRVAYFWALMGARGWLGVIDEVPTPSSKRVPSGFFYMPVEADGKVTPFIGASYQVKVFEPNVRSGGRGREVIAPPAGTKVVPLLKRLYSGSVVVDENALHKAQTGAIGRALGLAGMLIVPGSGIATYEDMMELYASEGAVAVLPEAEKPQEAEAEKNAGGLRERIEALRDTLLGEYPQAYEEAAAWATEKGYELADPPDRALRGLERQLQRKLEQAQAQAPGQHPHAPDEPA